MNKGYLLFALCTLLIFDSYSNTATTSSSTSSNSFLNEDGDESGFTADFQPVELSPSYPITGETSEYQNGKALYFYALFNKPCIIRVEGKMNLAEATISLDDSSSSSITIKKWSLSSLNYFVIENSSILLNPRRRSLHIFVKISAIESSEAIKTNETFKISLDELRRNPDPQSSVEFEATKQKPFIISFDDISKLFLIRNLYLLIKEADYAVSVSYDYPSLSLSSEDKEAIYLKSMTLNRIPFDFDNTIKSLSLFISVFPPEDKESIKGNLLISADRNDYNYISDKVRSYRSSQYFTKLSTKSSYVINRNNFISEGNSKVTLSTKYRNLNSEGDRGELKLKIRIQDINTDEVFKSVVTYENKFSDFELSEASPDHSLLLFTSEVAYSTSNDFFILNEVYISILHEYVDDTKQEFEYSIGDVFTIQFSDNVNKSVTLLLNKEQIAGREFLLSARILVGSHTDADVNGLSFNEETLSVETIVSTEMDKILIHSLSNGVIRVEVTTNFRCDDNEVVEVDSFNKSTNLSVPSDKLIMIKLNKDQFVSKDNTIRSFSLKSKDKPLKSYLNASYSIIEERKYDNNNKVFNVYREGLHKTFSSLLLKEVNKDLILVIYLPSGEYVLDDYRSDSFTQSEDYSNEYQAKSNTSIVELNPYSALKTRIIQNLSNHTCLYGASYNSLFYLDKVTQYNNQGKVIIICPISKKLNLVIKDISLSKDDEIFKMKRSLESVKISYGHSGYTLTCKVPKLYPYIADINDSKQVQYYLFITKDMNQESSFTFQSFYSLSTEERKDYKLKLNESNEVEKKIMEQPKDAYYHINTVGYIQNADIYFMLDSISIKSNYHDASENSNSFIVWIIFGFVLAVICLSVAYLVYNHLKEKKQEENEKFVNEEKAEN